MSLSFYYQNARGLRTKTITFLRNLLKYNYDFVCITETWLVPGILDSELFDSRYNVYRTDRDCEKRGMTRGGGTLVAVRRELRAVACPVVSLPDADITCLDISLTQMPLSKKFRLFTCYFPQGKEQRDSQSIFFEYLSDLHVNNPDDIFLVLGDFNIGDAVWSRSDDMSHGLNLDNPYFNVLINQLSALLCFCSWRQFNHIPNKNGRNLDLVLSNRRCSVASVDPLVPVDAHHPVLGIDIDTDLTARHLKTAPRTIRRFFAADYTLIESKLSEINWSSQLATGEIDSAVDCFYSIVNKVIHELVPSKTVSKRSFPSWYSHNLITLLKKKK